MTVPSHTPVAENTRVLRTIVPLALLFLFLAIAAAGCNTVKGLGDDIKSAGEAGQDAISGN